MKGFDGFNQQFENCLLKQYWWFKYRKSYNFLPVQITKLLFSHKSYTINIIIIFEAHIIFCSV